MNRVECRLPDKYYRAYKNVASSKGMSIGKVVKLALEARYSKVHPVNLTVPVRAILLGKLSKILTAISNLYDPINSESSNLNQAMKFINYNKSGLNLDESVLRIISSLTPDKTRKPLINLDNEVTRIWQRFVNYHR